MKKLLYILLLPLFLSSCVREKLVEPTVGSKTTVSFDLNMSDFSPIRGDFDENQVTPLQLWVFDEHGLFLELSDATVQSNLHFTASILPSESKRIIHFISNHPLTQEQAANWVGHDEKEILSSIFVQNKLCMWARKEYANIPASASLGSIALLRNMAKFGLSVTTDKLKDCSYKLCNVPDRGTLLPFRPTDANPFPSAFMNDPFVTEHAGLTLTSEQSYKPLTNYFYSYEWFNTPTVAHANKVTSLILKAKYENSPNFSYYKIDIVNVDKERYRIFRNHFYKIVIKDALTAGAASEADALAGAAANNLALNPEVQMYPSFSDGEGRLEVDHTYLVFTKNDNEGTIHVDYFPSIASSDTDNGKLTLSIQPDGESQPAVYAVSNSNGTVTLKLNHRPTTGYLSSNIVIGVMDKPDLKRLVKVFVRHEFPYDLFQATSGSNSAVAANNQVSIKVAKAQNSQLKFEVVLPEEFNPALLPTVFRFKTQHFYPADIDPSNPSQDFIFGNENSYPYYDYTLSSMPDGRKFTVYFKSNKSASAETMLVRSRSNYFYEQKVVITN